MSATSPCVPCCSSTTETVNVPGTAGVNAYTTTVDPITIPVGAGPGAVDVANTSWMAVGQILFISDDVDYAHFQVTAIPSITQVTLDYLGYNGDATAGAVIGTGATVSPAGPTLATPISIANGGTGAATAGAARSALLEAALDAEAVITDNSTGTATDTVAAGVGIFDLVIPHTFIGGTAAVDTIKEYTFGFNFKILSWSFVTEVLLVGAGGSRVANMEIGTTDVGTVPSTITIPIANAAVGTVTDGTAVAGANTGGTAAIFSIEIASGGTQFTAGSGVFIVRIQNMDTANAVASLAAKLNTVLTALKP